MFDMAHEQAKAEAIPRYETPVSESEPPCGACWNCAHACDVTIQGKTYTLCVSERDLRSEGDAVDVTDQLYDFGECKDWEEHE